MSQVINPPEGDRDLDIQIAAAVFGWTRGGEGDRTSPAHKTRTIIQDGQRFEEVYLDYDSKGPHDRLTDPEGRVIYLCGCRDAEAVLPRFSTDIAEAWEVVEKLEIGVLPWLKDGVQGYVAGFEPPTGSVSWFEAVLYEWPADASWAFAETAPLAICRAALKALQPQSDSTLPQ